MSLLNLNTSANRRWLSLRQAAVYSPYGKKKLTSLIKEHKIKGGKLRDNKNAWFIDRFSLDKYLDSQCLCNDTEKKIVEFMKGFI
jgi:hypothetical protein